MRPLLLALLAGTALLAPRPAAAGVELGLGPVDEIDGESAWIATASWLTGQRHPWEYMLGVIGSRDMTESGPTDEVLFVSVSKRLTWRGWFAQGGVAWADSDNEVLSKHFQFQTGIGYDFGRVSVSLRHLSNANTGGRNRGETWALLQYGF